MEAIVGAGATIAVVANLIEFSTLLAKVIHRISGYRDRLDYAPKAVRDIDAKLGLLRVTVERAVQRAKAHSAAADAWTAEDLVQIQRVADGCGATIKDSLLPLLEKVLPLTADSRWRRMKRAIGSVKNEDELNRAWDRVEGYEKMLSSYFAVINNPSVNLPTPAKPAGPLFVYPARLVRSYIERSAGDAPLIDSVARHLSKQDVKPNVAVLVGMGGTGKTQLALRYCQMAQNGGECRTILWVDASSPSAAIKSFQDFARRATPGAVMSDSSAPDEGVGVAATAANAAQEDVMAVLRYIQHNGPWVMVFDNYDRPREFNVQLQNPRLKSIRDLWPNQSSGQVLITTRSRDCERLGKVFGVGRLSRREANQLLRDLLVSSNLNDDLASSLSQSSDEPNTASGVAVDPSTSIGDAPDIDNIVQTLGCLALAIDQAAAYIRSQGFGISAKAFLEHYHQRCEVVLSSIPNTRDWEYQHSSQAAGGLGVEENVPLSVFTTWELSLSCLSGSEAEKSAKIDFISLLGFLDPSRLDEKIFRQSMERTSSEPGPQAPSWATLFRKRGRWDPYLFGDVVSELKQLSLLESLRRADSNCQFSIHPLVSDWIKLRLSDVKRHEIAVQVFWMLRFSMPDDINVSNEDLDMTEVQMLATHLSICAQSYRNLLRDSPPLGTGELQELGCEVNAFLSHADMPEISMAICTDALEWRNKHNEPWNTAYLELGRSLSSNYFRLWQHKGGKAEKLSSELYQAAIETLGSDHELTLRCMSRVGYYLTYRGRFDEAEQHLRDCYDRQKQVSGPTSSWTLVTLGYLARLFERLDRHREARAYIDEAFNILRATYGPYHATTLQVEVERLFIYSAGELEDMGDDIIDCATACTSRLRKRYSETHTLCISAKTHLAHAYSRLGQNQEANLILQRLLALGSQLSQLVRANIYALLTMAAFRAKQPDRLKEYADAAIQIYRESGNLLWDFCLRVCAMRSGEYMADGEFDKGQRLWQEILNAYQETGETRYDLEEKIYWGLYWLLASHIIFKDKRQKSRALLKECLRRAEYASRMLRKTEPSVIEKLQYAAIGYRLLGDATFIDINSYHLLVACTRLHQPSYRRPEFLPASTSGLTSSNMDLGSSNLASRNLKDDLEVAAATPLPNLVNSICSALWEWCYFPDRRMLGLGVLFLHFGDTENAQIAFEQALSRDGFESGAPNAFGSSCDVCGQPIRGTQFICAACPDVAMDADCHGDAQVTGGDAGLYVRTAPGAIPRGCSRDHQFLRVPREEWLRWENGMVSEDEKLGDWLITIKNKYAGVEVPQSLMDPLGVCETIT